MNYEIALGILSFVIIITIFVFAIIGIVLLIKRPSPKKWLFKELEIWEKELIISSDEKTKIEKHYEIPVKERTPPIKIIIIIGSVLLGIGLILFIASNWQAISGNIKLLLTFTLSIIALLYGYYLKYNTKKPLPILGDGLLFLSTIIFGATIIFLFQHFQISADNNYLLVFLWGATIFPVAYFLKSDPVFYLSAILLFLSGIFYSNLTDLPNYYYLILGLFPFLLISENKKHRWIPVAILSLLMPIFSRFEMYGTYYLLLIILFLIYYFIKKNELYFSLASFGLFFFVITEANYPFLGNYLGRWFFLLPLFGLLWLIFWKKIASSSLFILLLVIPEGLLIQFANMQSEGLHAVSFIKLLLMVGSIYLLLERFVRIKFMKLPFQIWGYSAVLISTFVLSFYELIKTTLKTFDPVGFLFWGRFAPFRLLSLIIVILFVFLLLLRIFKRLLFEKGDNYILILSFLAFLGLAIWEYLPLTPLPYIVWILTFYQNGLLLVILLFSIFWAYQREMNWLINANLFFFLVFILVRYFDLSWQLLNRSLFFILGGVILLLIGFFMETIRRKITSEEQK